MSLVEDHVAFPVGPDDGGELPDLGERAHDLDSRVINRLADELLPVLIDRLSKSSLGELEIRQDGWRVRLRRAPDNGAEVIPAPPARSERSPEHQPESARPPARTRPRNGDLITSPAVGYYQHRDGVAAGAGVRGGDLLGHVDVLGVLHDVVVPEDGRLLELLAESGEAVEYGQPLARLEPESRG